MNRAKAIRLRDRQNASHSSVWRRRRHQSDSQSCYSGHRWAHRKARADRIFTKSRVRLKMASNTIQPSESASTRPSQQTSSRIDRSTSHTSLHAMDCKTRHMATQSIAYSRRRTVFISETIQATAHDRRCGIWRNHVLQSSR